MIAKRPRPTVLHAPVEVSGQAALAAFGLREIGVNARCFARPDRFAYPVSPDIDPGPTRAGWIAAAVRAASTSDIVHYYYGESLLRGQSLLPGRMKAFDARALRWLGRRVIVEFMGTDVRLPSVEAARNPHFVPKGGQSDQSALARMRTWSWATGGQAIVNDPALITFVAPQFEHVHFVPVRVDTHRLEAEPPGRDVRRPLLVHAPSHLAVKGTSHVRSAVDLLRKRGVDFEYKELRGLSNREVTKICAQADLVVDQLCLGSYGVFAAEAMSMGKPVVCYLHPDVISLYPTGLPIIRATPDTLLDVLAEWLQKPTERYALGVESRRYAETVHDVRVVARRLLDVYEDL